VRILIIDNYDSFTYNLVDMLRTLGVSHDVVLNDQMTFTETPLYDGAILSPGPGLPEESGQLMSFLQHCHQKLPVLGICLGHQAIAQLFGANLKNLSHPRHGKTMKVEVDTSQAIFKGIDPSIMAGFYHSWEVDASTLPPELTTIACWRNVPMALKHQQHPLTGLQFHPESYATKHGLQILANWLLTL